MTDSDGGTDDQTQTGARGRKRVRLAIGVTAMAALLGGGAYLITDQVTTKDAATAEGQAPPAAADSAPGSASPSPGAASGRPYTSTTTSAAAQVTPTGPAAARSLPPEVRKSIDAARERMRKDGVEVKRPVVPKVPQAAAQDIETTTQGSLKEGGIVRVLSARGDLTGQRELAYVAGGVQKYRDVSCSQTFQFSTNPKPAKKDNLLMCWRTSATKSVAAIVVDPKGHPSKDKALAALEHKWGSMA
jgi:hypothetical protein